ncbi:UbiA family prenyltransferase [Methanococcus voltae]|uniref:Digeranylgeranylglyceryl phosphate synthase n=1 Tax=Methanococcus voltae (strain ATCC BAA-1334 / A3) TaxID=456320 RepID=D7DUX5_METV3|nr:UbiA family prenyltransferase [Methanococcus voltae]MCS3900739.1 geranylgeranylglycerol-phosphate geranylgeranyltransferase [Methanococcus voltae]
MNILAYFELLRTKNCISASIGALISALIASNFQFNYSKELILIFLVVFLICGYGNAINDICDLEIDKINKPERPIPSGRVSLKSAKIFSTIIVILGVFLSFFNIYCTLLAIFNAIVLYLYAKRYKKNKIVGNVLVGYLTGSVFLFGGIAVNNVYDIGILFVSALLAIWSREIIKDYEDIEGDELEGVISLPIKNKPFSLKLATLLLILAILVSPIPYLIGIFGIYYLIAIIICDILFLLALYPILKSKFGKKDIDAKKISKNIKLTMNLVLLSYIIGSIL